MPLRRKHSAVAASNSERHAEALGFDSESTLRALESSTDSDGTRHYRYQQYFRGIPVWGEHVVVAEDSSGSLKSLFGRSVSGLAMEIPVRAPLVSAGSALAAAKLAAFGSRQSLMRTENESSRQMIYRG